MVKSAPPLPLPVLGVASVEPVPDEPEEFDAPLCEPDVFWLDSVLGALPPLAPAADIHVAGRDHAIERRGYAFVALQRDNPVKVGLEGFNVALRGSHVRHLRLVVGLLLVAVLPRQHAAGDQRLVAVVGDLVQRKLRLLLLQLRLRLVELLFGLIHLRIQIRRLDDRQQLAFANVVADIDVSPLQVAIGPRVYRRFDQRRRSSRHHQAAAAGRPLHLHRLDLGVSIPVLGGQLVGLPLRGQTRDHARDQRNRHQHHHTRDHPVENPARLRLLERLGDDLLHRPMMLLRTGAAHFEGMAEFRIVERVGVGE